MPWNFMFDMNGTSLYVPRNPQNVLGAVLGVVWGARERALRRWRSVLGEFGEKLTVIPLSNTFKYALLVVVYCF